MKKLIKDNLSFVIRFSIILFFLIFLICLLILQTNVYFAEMWTTTVSRFYQTAVGSIFKYLPFSVTELVFAELITTTIVFIIYLIKNFVTKRYKEGFSITTNLVLIYVVFIFTYVSTTSITYYRAPLEIELYEENVDKSEFRPIIEHF